MKNLFLILLISVIAGSCASSKMNNFLKYNDPNYKKVIFQKESKLYFIRLSQDQIAFYMKKTESPNIVDLKDIRWEKYLIDPSVKDSETDEFLDEFGLDDDNYSYKSAKDFFASTFNEIFQKGMSGESQRMSAYKPRSLSITSIDNSYFQNFNQKTFYSPKDSIILKVFEPIDINLFCKNFKEKYSDANFLIVVGQINVTQDMFEDDISFDSPSGLSYPKGTMIIPKVVIDLEKDQIAGYHVGIFRIDPGAFSTVRGAIEGAMISDTEEMNFFF